MFASFPVYVQFAVLALVIYAVSDTTKGLLLLRKHGYVNAPAWLAAVSGGAYAGFLIQGVEVAVFTGFLALYVLQISASLRMQTKVMAARLKAQREDAMKRNLK